MSSLPRPILWLILLALGLVFVFVGSALAQAGEGGAELFEYWCSTCHGDRGQGLTDEWRATWPEDKQYCWQSKCHATNHPPEGFTFPKTVPAVIGPEALTKFQTGQDLYAYVRAAMPYWAPGKLSDEEYREVTLFLVEANYAARDVSAPVPLSQDLPDLPLHSSPEMKSPSQPAVPWPWFLGLALVLAAGTGGVLWYRSRSSVTST